jgi:TPR repeat protein
MSDLENDRKLTETCIHSEFLIGISNYCGIGVKKDLREAFIRFMNADSEGYCPAKFALGIMHLLGEGDKKDLNLAAYHFSEVIKKGVDDKISKTKLNSSMSLLGEKKIRFDSLDMFKVLVLTDEEDFLLEKDALGISSFGSLEMDKALWHDYVEENAFIGSLMNLGAMSRKGEGINKDYSVSLFCHRVAGIKGVPEAQNILGEIYDNGEGIKKNKIEAFYWFKLAAQNGITDAQLELAKRYENGTGVSKNSHNSLHWYQIAAVNGNEKAKVILEDKFISEEENYCDEASNLFGLIAEQGNIDGIKILGSLYSKRLNPNMFKEENVYRIRVIDASREHMDEQFRLGMVYEENFKQIQELEKIVKYMPQTLVQNSVDEVIEMFLEGELKNLFNKSPLKDRLLDDPIKCLMECIKKDHRDYLEKAINLYTMASKQGHKKAEKRLKVLKMELENLEQEI